MTMCDRLHRDRLRVKICALFDNCDKELFVVVAAVAVAAVVVAVAAVAETWLDMGHASTSGHVNVCWPNERKTD